MIRRRAIERKSEPMIFGINGIGKILFLNHFFGINGIVRNYNNIREKPTAINSAFFYKHDSNIFWSTGVLTKDFSNDSVPLLHVW